MKIIRSHKIIFLCIIFFVQCGLENEKEKCTWGNVTKIEISHVYYKRDYLRNSKILFYITLYNNSDSTVSLKPLNIKERVAFDEVGDFSTTLKEKHYTFINNNYSESGYQILPNDSICLVVRLQELNYGTIVSISKKYYNLLTDTYTITYQDQDHKIEINKPKFLPISFFVDDKEVTITDTLELNLKTPIKPDSTIFINK